MSRQPTDSDPDSDPRPDDEPGTGFDPTSTAGDAGPGADDPTVPPFLADLLDERDCRALQETMFPSEKAPDLYRVRTASGGDYRVDAREPACTCPDFQYRETRCKHIRRVELESGDRDPRSVSRAVDWALSRVDGRIADLAARRSEPVALQSAAERFDSR
jgi:hypothetical protein